MAEAEKALSRAIELDGKYPPAVFGRGVVRLRSRRYREAVHDLETACRLAPEALPWRLELAKALLGTSKTDEALTGARAQRYRWFCLSGLPGHAADDTSRG